MKRKILAATSSKQIDYIESRLRDFYGPEYGLNDDVDLHPIAIEIDKAARLYSPEAYDLVNYWGSPEEELDDARYSGGLDENTYDTLLQDNFPENVISEYMEGTQDVTSATGLNSTGGSARIYQVSVDIYTDGDIDTIMHEIENVVDNFPNSECMGMNQDTSWTPKEYGI